MAAQGWSAATTLALYVYIRDQTLKGFANCRTLSGFAAYFVAYPRVVAPLQPWAAISERLRRNSN